MTKTPMFPRDSAGSFTLPSDSGEPISVMCSLDDRLELYTETETFMVQSPETIDPGRTNAHAPWVNVRTHSVGSASPYVARTVLMANEMLNQAAHPPSEDARRGALRSMHTIKETLLQCASAAMAISTAIASEEAAVRDSGFKLEPGGRALARFPLVHELEAKITAFLIPARRCITEVCQLPGHFMEVTKPHSDVGHLLNKELKPRFGEASQLVRFVADCAPFAARVVDLRNGQEHTATTRGRPLTIRNFHHLPDGSIARPAWMLEGDEPSDIEGEVNGILEDLLAFAEVMFVSCLDQTKPVFPPLILELIDPLDPRQPVRFRLGIDASKLGLPLAGDA
jgi:hypothetical protein